MSEKIWSDDAWKDYLYWQTQDKKTIKRIHQLIKDIVLYYSGVSQKEAVKLMGHSDIKLIMEVYAHLDEEKEAVEEKTNNAISF